MPTEINIYSQSPKSLEPKNLQIFFLTVFRQLMSFRVPMMVRELLVFQSHNGPTGYYKCPRCGITVEREFMSFCDRCGQRLDWKEYRKAVIVHITPRKYPSASKHESGEPQAGEF